MSLNPTCRLAYILFLYCRASPLVADDGYFFFFENFLYYFLKLNLSIPCLDLNNECL